MKALLLLLVSGSLAAGVFIAGKQAGHDDIPPLLILFWQLTGGALVIWIFSLATRSYPAWKTQHLRYYLVGGLLGISIPYILAFNVLKQLQVGTVGLLTALSPMITYVIARLLRMEQGHPLRLLGLCIGLGGVVLLATPQQGGDLQDNWGYLLLALGIPVSLAASNIYRSHYWPAGSDALSLVTGMLTVQSLCLLVINLLWSDFSDAIPANLSTGGVLTALGFIAGGSYLSTFKLLKVGGPVYLSQMGYVITAVTLLAGIVIWDEQYDYQDLFSMGLIFSGVLLTTLTNRIPRISTVIPADAGRQQSILTKQA